MAGAAGDFVRERAALQATLAAAGPDAPTAVDGWTAEDLAVHVAIGELSAAVPNAPFRWLVGKGVRLDRLAPLNARALRFQRRRHGFEWALARLDRPPPRLHRVGVVAAVSLLEMWAHHEDVLLANPHLGPCTSGVDLTPVIDVLKRYHRRALATKAVPVAADPAHLARWMSGRAEGVEDLQI